MGEWKVELRADTIEELFADIALLGVVPDQVRTICDVAHNIADRASAAARSHQGQSGHR